MDALLKKGAEDAYTLWLKHGCYSPATSIVSRATIRSTNIKESKEKRNRQKLLGRGLGSDFSLSASAQDMDLEMDYYDYNVVNAGAAPGSYLGMDPAFLVWIPPLEECAEVDLEQANVYADPGSNKESPEEESLLPRETNVSSLTPRSSPLLSKKLKRIHPLVLVDRSSSESIKFRTDSPPKPMTMIRMTSTQMQEIARNRKKILSPVEVHREKETKVEKSPSIENNVLDDIRYVDEDCDDDRDSIRTNNQCNVDGAYQDSNILSSV